MNAPSSEHRTDPPRRAAVSDEDRPRRRHARDDVIAGRYRLVEHLGSGGMGTVWLGRDQALERQVAIKFMSEDASANRDLRQRFRREARAAAALNSKHVVEIYDHGVDDGTPYIVMERLEGEDLRTRLKRLGVLGLPEVMDIVVQAGKALQRAQKAGIVHRDLKPANLFLANVDNEELVKVLDFGVAKHMRGEDDSHATKTGVVLGSPPYMSPEQARGRELDHRADLWSLAAIAYRALTGHIPFSGESDGDIIVKICTEPPAPASTYVPAFGPELDAVFERAFQRNPDKRYQNAHDLAAAFCKLGGIDAPPTIIATPVSGETALELDSPAPADGPTELMSAGSRAAAKEDAVDTRAETTPLHVAGPLSHRPSSMRRYAPVALLLFGGLVAAVALWPSGEEAESGSSAGTSADEAPTVPEPAPQVAVEGLPSTTPSATAQPTASASASPEASVEATAAPPTKRPPRPAPQAAPPKPDAEPGNPWGY